MNTERERPLPRMVCPDCGYSREYATTWEADRATANHQLDTGHGPVVVNRGAP